MMRTPMAELWSVAAWIGLVVGVILVVAPQASAQIFEMGPYSDHFGGA